MDQRANHDGGSGSRQGSIGPALPLHQESYLEVMKWLVDERINQSPQNDQLSPPSQQLKIPAFQKKNEVTLTIRIALDVDIPLFCLWSFRDFHM